MIARCILLLVTILWKDTTVVNCMTVKARCSGVLDVYADGVSKGSHNSESTTKAFTLPDTTEVVALKCVIDTANSTRAGMFASFNSEFEGDYVTDNTWKCSNTLSADWNTASFDDSYWGYAESSGTNAATANGLTRIPSLPSYVRWIWTSLYTVATGDDVVYCRGFPKVSQTYDTYGRRFVMGFMDNYETGSPRKDLKILVTTLIPSPVTVIVKTPRLSNSLKIDTSFTIEAGNVHSQTIPNLRHYDTNVKDMGILAISTQPIKIIGLNTEASSTDMVLFLPLTSLGTYTTVNTYYTVTWDATNTYARALFVAGYDSTSFTVNSPVSFTYAGATKDANKDYTFTLTYKYQSVQVFSTNGFTGSKVTSTKPLVVYSGNELTGISNGQSGTSRDHLVEQLTPTRNWGKDFILTPMPYFTNPLNGRMGSVLEKYKYVAAENDTDVTVKNYDSSGTLLTTHTFTLGPGEYKDLDYQRGSHAVVTSNKGIQVAQFATSMVTASSSYNTAGNCMGDPWLQLIPASNVFSRDYGLLTPLLTQSSSCPAQHYITVVVAKNKKDGITINGDPLDWSSGVDVTTTDQIYVTKNIPYHATNGIRIQHNETSVSFGVYFFGYGRHDSYATGGGLRIVPVNEACQTTSGTLGDKLDNNCNGKVDEDDCGGVNDVTKDCAPPVPVNGNWANWTNQGLCVCPSNSINGQQTRVRTCSDPVPRYGGLKCDTSVQGNTKQEACQCNPIDGQWTDWDSWTACTATCGSATKSRTKKCRNPAPAFGGQDCSGNDTEVQNCQLSACPIPENGGWSAWVNSTICDCTQDAYNGTRNQTRQCNNPSPANGGNDCSGVSHRIAHCDCVSESSSGPKFAVDWTTKSECSNSAYYKDNSDLATCLQKCADNSSCLTVVYQQNEAQRCSLLNECTEVNSTIDSVVFIKKIETTTVGTTSANVAGNANAQSGGEGATTAAVVGAAVGGVAGLAALAGIIFLVARRRKKEKEEEKEVPPNSSDATDMDVEDMEATTNNTTW